MTQVNSADGPIETTLPPDAVADLQQPAEAPKEETPKAPETPANPEPTAKPAEPKAEEPKPEPVKEPDKEPEPVSRKAKPIANLLAQKHEAEERASSAEKRVAELETKLTEAANKPAGTEATADIKALAEKHGLDEGILADIVATARAGFKTELPPEVADLLQERENAKQLEAEHAAFDTRVDSLSKILNDEQLKDNKVRDKLLKLAYSTDKAPDGEPYYQKELAELYIGFIKPEIEPGKPSAEPSRGGSSSGTKVIDFQDILDRDDPKDIESMDDATFTKYTAWMKEKQGNPPIKRSN